MKAYKVTVLVIGDDELEESGIREEMENVRYPNHCMYPRIMEIEEADIGEWTDEHPLNQRDTKQAEFEKIFLKENL